MNQSGGDDLVSSLLIERFKSVLSEKERLNRDTEVYFRAYLTVLVGAAGLMTATLRSDEPVLEPMVAAANFTIVALSAFGALIALLTLVNVFGWFDLRQEEAAILNAAKPGSRQRASWLNFWRWRETYLLATIMLMSTLLISSRAGIVAILVSR